MKHKLIAGLILAGSSLFAAPGFSVGVRFGAPAPVAPVYATPCPGPDYVWIGGRWEHRPVVEHRERFLRHDDRRDFHRR